MRNKVLFILFWIVCVPSTYVYADTLQDTYFTGYNDGENTNSSTKWITETFTAGAGYTLSSVDLRLRRNGSPGTGTVSIRATSGGVPVAPDLTSGTFDADTISTDNTNGQVVNVPLTHIALTNGVKYAIVIRGSATDASNYIKWFAKYNNGTYADGSWYTNASSGVDGSWDDGGTPDLFDFMFQTYSAVDGGGGTGTTSTSTLSTVDSFGDDLFHGMFLFMTAFLGVIFFFKRNAV